MGAISDFRCFDNCSEFLAFGKGRRPSFLVLFGIFRLCDAFLVNWVQFWESMVTIRAGLWLLELFSMFCYPAKLLGDWSRRWSVGGLRAFVLIGGRVFLFGVRLD